MSWQPHPPQQEQSGLSVAALVLGICGFLVCPLVCSIAAIVTGTMAKNEIDRSGGRLTGRDYAKAGLILGWIGVGLCVLAALAILALVVFAVGATESLDYYAPTPAPYTN